MQFYYRLREFPFLRIIILFCIGIITGYYCPPAPTYILLTAAIFISLSVFAINIIASKTLKGLIITTVFFICGLWVIQNKLRIPDIDITQKSAIRGQVISYPVKKNNYTKFIIKSEGKTNAPLKLLTYIFTEDSLHISKGDLLEFNAKLKKIENRKDQSFDYRQYMRRQYVEYTAFVADYDYHIVESKRASFTKFCSKIRSFIVTTLSDSGIQEPELGLMNAMLLGIKGNLDTDIKNNYIAAGGIHFLAISGLHTGIVFILISFLLHNLFRLRKSGIAFLILALGLLWIYAIITGLAPSVLRASIILSFILIGKYIKRDANLYNAIASSAFLILLFDPGTLFSPGFQLSYAAYSSIIYLYPKIYSLVICKSKLLNNIWQLLSVSLAAQLGTLPLSIFYFHHIYYYSLLTNICVSVFIPIIIYGGFISIGVSFLLPGNNLVSYSLSLVVKFVNRIIDIIAHLSGAISENIIISLVETILIYSIIVVSFMMVWYKKRKLVFIILIATLLLMSYQSYMRISNNTGIQKEINSS